MQKQNVNQSGRCKMPAIVDFLARNLKKSNWGLKYWQEICGWQPTGDVAKCDF
jgi:hypothetical protein